MTLKKKILIIFLSLLGIFLILEAAGYYFMFRDKALWSVEINDLKIKEKSLNELKSRNQFLQKKLKSLAPREVYIVIDTGQNKLYLKKDNKVLREAVISCGSGDILQEPDGERRWVFDTPRGEFYVKSKLVDPYWIKPDWAFIEEGEEIPKKLEDRVDSGVLGNYALGFGNGYFIHGTLYTRLLGRNVTHGCIRVGDEDLKTIFRVSSIGTKIFIF